MPIIRRALKCQLNDATGIKEVVVRGPWKPEYAEYVRKKGLALYLNHALGFEGGNLDFLSDLPDLRSLRVIGAFPNHHGVEFCHNLELLSLNTGGKKPIDYGCFNNLKSLFTYGLGKNRSVRNCISLERLYVYGFADESCRGLSTLTNLRDLTLGPAKRLTTAEGLEQLNRLERLAIYHAPALEDVTAVSSLRLLKELDISHCRRIPTIDFVEPLKYLRKFKLSECGDIETLEPLTALPELEVFNAHGSTRVLDNDLSVLGRVPKLEEVYLMKRRTYFGLPDRFHEDNWKI